MYDENLFVVFEKQNQNHSAKLSYMAANTSSQTSVSSNKIPVVLLFILILYLCQTHSPGAGLEINRFRILDDDYQVEWKADSPK
ncbi:unnamed protein product [Allacma fusca]|uniref:Uncharacterized protein n=1 Tax=Allacma fusca TaxID=39272 RepID=A0A8J2NV03_9HEXA|nr:unnamed protein product [Allacma fusca]